jgi:signal transduction histidine kinase
MRIRGKISLFVVPLATVPMILIGLFSHRSLTKAFAEQIYLDEKRLCQLTAARLERALDECRDGLLLLSSLLKTEIQKHDDPRLEKIISADGSPIQTTAKAITIRHSPYVKIRLILANGKEVFAAQELRTGFAAKSALREPIFLQAVAVASYGYRFITQFPPGKISNKQFVATTFSIPLYHNTTLLGFVFLDYDLAAFSKILREAATASPGYYFLHDGGGKIIVEAGKTVVSESDFSHREYQSALQRMRSNPQPVFVHQEYSASGKRFFISARPVKEYMAFREPLPEERWYLAIVRSELPLLLAFRRNQLLLAAVLAFGLVISILGAFYISDKITTPIGQLSAATHEFAQGNLESSLEVKSRDELGELAADFGVMTTQLKQLIRERQANEMLIAIGRFSAALAHDLRNPVEGLKLLCHELRKRVKPNHAEREIADALAQSVDNLSTLVNQSLDFARLSKPEFAPTDLTALADEVLADLRFDDVELKKDYAANLPRVDIDPAQIKRVLGNLITNALEACRSKKISAPCRLSLVLHAAGEKVRLEVADTGTGIPADIREKIFEPFFSTKPGGHGLGLALARQIIANHGGTIAFNSEMGQGTKFCIDLPISQGHFAKRIN